MQRLEHRTTRDIPLDLNQCLLPESGDKVLKITVVQHQDIEWPKMRKKQPVRQVGAGARPAAVLRLGAAPRVALVCANGRQVAHLFLPAVLAAGVDYL